jgi:hypothetical protein
MSEPINFDRAEYVEVSELNCKLCREPLRYEYYDMSGGTICRQCRDKIVEGRDVGGGFQRFLRAAAFGLVAAAIGAVLYALIVKLTGLEIGLVAVLLGFMVGKSVSTGSYHTGGWRYQALAMFLTYAAICVGYMPAILRGAGGRYTLALIVVAFLISLSVPFGVLIYGGMSGILGPIIIGIGLYEAWKLNKPGLSSIGGPYPISPPRESIPLAG